MLVLYSLNHKTCAEDCFYEVDECPVAQGCPKNAIEEVLLAGGDRVPKITKGCNNCGTCYKLCDVGAVEKYFYETEKDRENFNPSKILKMVNGKEVKIR